MGDPWGRCDEEIQEETPENCQAPPRLSGLGDSKGPSYTAITW